MTGLIEASTRAELLSMGADLDVSALARTAVDLAARLDGDGETVPTDRDATTLSRELRMVLRDLHERHDSAGGDLDAWLAGISAPSFRQSGD